MLRLRMLPLCTKRMRIRRTKHLKKMRRLQKLWRPYYDTLLKGMLLTFTLKMLVTRYEFAFELMAFLIHHWCSPQRYIRRLWLALRFSPQFALTKSVDHKMDASVPMYWSERLIFVSQHFQP